MGNATTLPLVYATGNAEKFGIGQSICSQHGITLAQLILDVDEIQGEKPEPIVTDKAKKAFDLVQKPLVVTDDSWDIPGLNGFPGPYMKSMLQWFTVDDFLHLTQHLTDRRIILHEYLAYIDKTSTKLFKQDIPCKLATAPRGNFGSASMKIIVLDSDKGKTISEVYDAGLEHTEERLAGRSNSWSKFAEWYQQHAA